MSTENKSFVSSTGVMIKSFIFNDVMVGHGGYSEVARRHVEQTKQTAEADVYSPFNTVNS